ncbi:MAG TPA: hypothetical protein PKA88_04795 [Polyangiaceae bacterium]|nr:hypothetical protein [Polyangiaceae bacterium]
MDLLHPKIVHLPMALAVLMPLLAVGVWFAWHKQWLPKRTWWLVVAAQILLAASGFASMQTGEHDEERAERVVPERAIEQHEDAAKVFMAGSFVVLLLAGAVLLVRREEAARRVAVASAVGMFGVLALGVRVGQAGGALVYEHGAANAYVTPTKPLVPLAAAKHADEDDD